MILLHFNTLNLVAHQLKIYSLIWSFFPDDEEKDLVIFEPFILFLQVWNVISLLPIQKK